MEYTSGSATWGKAVRRAAGALIPRRGRPRSVWTVLTPLIALVAGFLFTTSANTAKGTALRDDRTPQLSSLIADRNRQVAADDATRAALAGQVDALTGSLAGSDADVAAQQNRGDASKAAAGLTAVHGPGWRVTLDDAPRRPDGSLPAGASVDDLVVHQQDVQAVVNALWAGGAEAMTIMGVRVISTIAVRCVGNTLLLNGRVYSPPFVITAIGDREGMRNALDASPGVQAYRSAVAAYGLGWSLDREDDVTLPAFQGSTTLHYAEPLN
ncbi:MAG TPA: DUF881 domain-containing protein [Rugosimonospora sp.]|nr:DUF881 domain-containing protein [Rugosimonospora sp.]